MVFFALFIIPLVVAVVTWKVTNGKVTGKELACQLGVQAALCIGGAVLLHYANMYDREVWNGVVTGKNSEHVSCTHTHSCNCRQSCSGSGKNQSCHEVCDQCPDHPFDVDWNVLTSNRETIKIDREDTQGLIQPSRWSAVRIGEPTSVEHAYKNYIKGSPDTLFRHQGYVEKYKGKLPKYPRVQDYYRINRLVSVNGAWVDNPGAWNADLDKLNAEVGAPKQANILVVLVKNLPAEFYYGLEESWIGGKKNDIVVVVGVDDQAVPQWAKIMAWSKNEMIKIKLRDDIMDTKGPLVRDTFLATVKADVNAHYQRKPMADFQYLEASITPTTGQLAIGIVVSLLVAIGLSWYFATHDPFGDERRARFNDLYSRGLYNVGRRKHW